MKKYNYLIISLTLIMILLMLLMMRHHINSINNINCENTNNQKTLLSCLIDKEKIIFQKDTHFKDYKNIIENHYNYKFSEFDNNYLEHDTDLFQKNYYFFVLICNFDKSCFVNDEKMLMSKLVCLTYSKACFFKARFIDNNNLKTLESCNKNICLENIGYLTNYLKNCNKYKGEDIFKNSELIFYFNQNKKQICKNFILDYKPQDIKYIRGNYDKKYEFLDDIDNRLLM